MGRFRRALGAPNMRNVGSVPSGTFDDPVKVTITKKKRKIHKRANPKKDLHYGDNYINASPFWGGGIDLAFTNFGIGDLYNQRAGTTIQVKSFSGKILFQNRNVAAAASATTARYVIIQWYPDDSTLVSGGDPPVITDIFVAGQLGTVASPTAQFNREQMGTNWGLLWDSGPVSVTPLEQSKVKRFKITAKQFNRGNNSPTVTFRTGVADTTGPYHIYGVTVGDQAATAVDIDGYTRLTFYP